MFKIDDKTWTTIERVAKLIGLVTGIIALFSYISFEAKLNLFIITFALLILAAMILIPYVIMRALINFYKSKRKPK